MKYTDEFKVKCFNYLRHCPVVDVRALMRAFDNNNHTVIRYALEDALDDEDLYEDGAVSDDGDRIVLNARINAYKQRTEIYSEFMEQLVTSMDKDLVYA